MLRTILLLATLSQVTTGHTNFISVDAVTPQGAILKVHQNDHYSTLRDRVLVYFKADDLSINTEASDHLWLNKGRLVVHGGCTYKGNPCSFELIVVSEFQKAKVYTIDPSHRFALSVMQDKKRVWYQHGNLKPEETGKPAVSFTE